MMEQPHARKGHDHSVPISGLDDVVIPNGAPRLHNVLHPAALCPLHIVAKGDERVGAAGDAAQPGHPGLLFLRAQRRGPLPKDPLPGAVCQQPGALLPVQIAVNGVVAVRTADILPEGEGQHLGVLPQPARRVQ